MSWEWIVGVLTIMYVNFILSGDNAVVIAMAVRSLPPKQRKLGLFWGSFGAVALLIVLTVVAAMLLEMAGLRLAGGLTLVWVTWKLVRPSSGDGDEHVKTSANLWEAVRIVIVADLIMSLDNVLGVAAAAKGKLSLLIFGLALSIPIILCCAAIIANLMNRYPWLVLLGGIILGKVAGELLVTDPLILHRIQAVAKPVEAVLPWVLAVLITAIARWRELVSRLSGRRPEAAIKQGTK
ncbi:MAG: TerC family protein [Candidatus Methylomirabilota bacterium]|jgi:YjbE family integral membrane protein